MTDEAHEFLMGGGMPNCKFLELGTKHEGTILALEKTQQRDFSSKELKTFKDGSPMWQLVFTLQTTENDPEIDDDDGRRKLYAKAQMLTAIRDEIKKSGHKGSVVGGTLGVKYAQDGEASSPGINPPKVYAVKFEAPAEDDPLEDLSDPF